MTDQLTDSFNTIASESESNLTINTIDKTNPDFKRLSERLRSALDAELTNEKDAPELLAFSSWRSVD